MSHITNMTFMSVRKRPEEHNKLLEYFSVSLQVHGYKFTRRDNYSIQKGMSSVLVSSESGVLNLRDERAVSGFMESPATSKATLGRS